MKVSPRGLALVTARAREAAGVGAFRARLPERVAATIAELEAQSEVLICLAQVAAIVFFTFVYSLTPKAFPPGVPFEPIPWALGLYAAFTGLRLYLALRRRLGRWFLRLSVIVDIAVLMLTIWSFHLQYQAPPALYLKAPTLFYVFIMIALRALRFEVELVVLTGLTAAVGWVILLAYALTSTAGMKVTHSFARYAMSNDVLIGAEVDKVMSILAVTAVLAFALARARAVLVTAVSERQVASDLSRFFAPDVARQIRDTDIAPVPGQGMIRDAAVLTTDLRGFTAIASRLSPAATMALLGEYQALVVPLIQANGGSIDKYLGDGILASFGATRPAPAFAADAVRAAEAILEAGQGWQAARAARGLPEIAIGLAIATGPLLFGTTGDSSRLEYTVIGEPVNLAAKLEKHTKVERARAVASAATLDLAADQDPRLDVSAWSRRGAVTVAGVETPLNIAVRV